MTPPNHESTLITWLTEDDHRMACLQTVARLNLPDWCIAAGFVRNLVWDRLHSRSNTSPLNDIDVLYFDRTDVSEARDRDLECRLAAVMDRPWSVKNQARMHHRNEDPPYRDTADAMRYWVEVETAIGARLDCSGQPQLVAPFGLDALMAGTITLNTQRPKPDAFRRRIHRKGWLTRWPRLSVVDATVSSTKQ